MKDEPDHLDPHEVKVLADILALVLQDQPGQSTVALEALRRKARQNRVTGGALKNLFQAIAAQSSAEAGAREWSHGIPDDPEARQASIERLRAANRNLEKALAAANGQAARLRTDFDQVHARLVNVQQQYLGLSESRKSGRVQAGMIGAAIATCVVVLSGVLVEQVLKSPAPGIAMQRPPPLFMPSPPPRAALPQPVPLLPNPLPPSTAGNTGPTGLSIENDPELQQTLQRLSHVAPREPAVEHDRDADPSAVAAVSTPPAPVGLPLTPEVHSAVVAHVKTCWGTYLHRLGEIHYQARLRVVTDEAGIIREAKLAREDVPLLVNPSYEAFAEAAIHSVLDPQCAQLPIPEAMRGHRIAFDFVFVP